VPFTLTGTLTRAGEETPLIATGRRCNRAVPQRRTASCGARGPPIGPALAARRPERRPWGRVAEHHAGAVDVGLARERLCGYARVALEVLMDADRVPIPLAYGWPCCGSWWPSSAISGCWPGCSASRRLGRSRAPLAEGGDGKQKHDQRGGYECSHGRPRPRGGYSNPFSEYNPQSVRRLREPIQRRVAEESVLRWAGTARPDASRVADDAAVVRVGNGAVGATMKGRSFVSMMTKEPAAIQLIPPKDPAAPQLEFIKEMKQKLIDLTGLMIYPGRSIKSVEWRQGSLSSVAMRHSRRSPQLRSPHDRPRNWVILVMVLPEAMEVSR